MTATFDWTAPELNKTHFTAFTNLLCLRDGGQVDSASLPDDELSDGYDDDWDVVSVDTSRAHQISNSGHARLKRKFLDCLAELAANKKDGRTVSCTAMKENEDGVTVWIARNEGFPERDKAIFDKIGLLLGRLSRGHTASPTQKSDLRNETHSSSDSIGTKAVKDVLWAEMLLYYQDRIQNDYVPKLRAAFEGKDKAKHSNSAIRLHPVSATKLSALRKLISSAAGLENAKLVNSAYELRAKEGAEGQAPQDQSVKITEKLWVEICLLSRLRVGLKKFEEIAMKLASFNEVTIVLLPHACASVKPPGNALSLKETLELLGLSADPQILKAVIRKRSVGGINRDFAKLQKQKIQVHAEVQMLLFLCTENPSFHGILPYLGCSKLSCFLCARLLQYHGSFGTKGCHGRVSKQWTVPHTTGLEPDQCGNLSRCLAKLQKAVRKELKAPIKEHKPQQKTSVIGGSSIVTDHREEGLQRQSEVTTWKLRAEQARVSEMFRRQTLEEEQSASQTTSTRTLEGRSNRTGECRVCDKMTSRKCSFCSLDFYCGESCQEANSWNHIFKCNRRPLTSADYLFKSLVEDRLSEEEEVLEDFGFHHLPSFADRSKLFGLYRGLMLSDRIGPEDLHKWRIEGTLVANIKDFYYKISETSRGGYFPWFLNHTDILDRRMTKEESSKLMVERYFDKARAYLDLEDQDKDAKDLEPQAKAQAYLMLACTLHMAHPNPIESNWYAFGFCTCNGEWEESRLGGLYQELLAGDELFEDVHRHLKFPMPGRRKGPKTTFAEFWRAFEAGKLIQLMDIKGLRDQRKAFVFLEEFLSVPPTGSWQSVWSLKQFVAISDPAEFSPIPAVRVDYGFVNCRKFEETCTLMEIYKRLLEKADPLALHRACLAGKLFEFASMYDGMDERYRRLMKNFYPLEEI